MLEKIKTEYFKRFNTCTKQTTNVRDGLSLNLYSAVQKIRNRPRKKKNLNDSFSFGQATFPFSLSGATSFSLWATRGAHNPNLQVFITHALHVHVCSQDLLGLPLSMNGMHKMQFLHFYPFYSDHACFDLWSHETYAKHSIETKAFGPPIVVASTP